MTMQDNGNTVDRHDVETARQIEKMRAESAYGRMREHLAKSDAALAGGDQYLYWHWRGQGMADQVEADRAAYAQQILIALLNPPAVPTYKPDHPGHDHHDADGADGRDAHAS